MKYSLASSPSAAMARVAGPPQGLKPLMMLSDSIDTVARIITLKIAGTEFKADAGSTI